MINKRWEEKWIFTKELMPLLEGWLYRLSVIG
jgi:hypothetical protein